MEDPSGNSFIENPSAPNKDVYMRTEYFPRTTQDYINMGYNEDASQEQSVIDREKFEADQPNQEKEDKMHKAIKKVKANKG